MLVISPVSHADTTQTTMHPKRKRRDSETRWPRHDHAVQEKRSKSQKGGRGQNPRGRRQGTSLQRNIPPMLSMLLSPASAGRGDGRQSGRRQQPWARQVVFSESSRGGRRRRVGSLPHALGAPCAAWILSRPVACDARTF
jgi:hypothetical protein